jgi:hypothetical protein
MNSRNRMSLPLRFCGAVTGADPDMLTQCHKMDGRRIVRHAVALTCSFSMAAALWSLVLNELLPLWGAIIGGLFAGWIIYRLDLSISASAWEMQWVFRESMFSSFSAFRRSLARKATLLLRLGLAGILALVAGTNISILWFNEGIQDKLHQHQILMNAPMEEDFRAKREHLHAELIAPLQDDLNTAMTERKNLQEMIVRTRQGIHEAEHNAVRARLDMHREENHERFQKRYYDAKIRLEEANRHMTRAQQDIDHARSRL